MITKGDVKKYRDAMQEAKSEYKRICQDYAEQECPLNIGDVVVCYGYAHRGKKMVVSVIRPARMTGCSWEVAGLIYKNNGNLGANTGVMDQEQYINKNPC